MPCKDPAKRKAYDAKYSVEHRQEKRAYHAKWRAENRDYVRSEAAKCRAERPEIHRAGNTRYYAKNQDKQRARQAKYYGCPTDLISQWEYACLNGVCEICGKPAAENAHGKLQKDHAHTDPPVPRGCLCSECNRGLGQFKDSPDLLTKAIQYLLARDPRYAK